MVNASPTLAVAVVTVETVATVVTVVITADVRVVRVRRVVPQESSLLHSVVDSDVDVVQLLLPKFSLGFFPFARSSDSNTSINFYVVWG